MTDNSSIQIETERIHSFDYLRAFAMLLGIVLHVSLSFIENSKDWWIVQDKYTSDFFYYLYYTIHLFRLPLFFIMAGYFGSMLLNRVYINKFLIHRFVRIGIPLIIFLIVLIPVIHSLHIYKEFFFGGGYAGSYFFKAASEYIFSSGFINNFAPAHLWFLYYLLFIYAVHAFVFRQINGKNIFDLSEYQYYLYLIFLVLFSFAVSLFTPYSLADLPDRTFVPEATTITYYGCFYFFGILLYRNPGATLLLVKVRAYLLILAILLLPFAFYTSGSVISPYLEIEKIVALLLATLCAWLFSTGITGVFYKYFNKENKIARYISDSSYWLYIIHVPVVMWLHIRFARDTYSPYIKFVLILLCAIIICLVSYHLLVRWTPLGKLLNGRRYKFFNTFEKADI